MDDCTAVCPESMSLPVSPITQHASGTSPAQGASWLAHATLKALNQSAAQLCQAPIALISMVDPNRQEILAHEGLPIYRGALPHLNWTLRTLQHDGVLQVADTHADPVFQADWLAHGEQPIRYYAGIALRDHDGSAIGTLCIMDHQPRLHADQDVQVLHALASSAALALTQVRTALPDIVLGGEACYRAIVEGQIELISLCAPDGTLLFVNAAYAAHFESTPEALIGGSVFDIVPAADRDAVASHFETVCTHGLILGLETRYVDEHGRVSWIAWTNSPTYDPQGKVIAVQSVGRDITERKLTERSLKESQARLRSLYESTPAMLHSLDAHGRLLSVSDVWLNKLGYTRREVIGRNSAEFLTQASYDYARNVVLPQYLRDSHVENIEYQMVRKDGTLIDVLLSATMERDEEGHPVRSLAVLEDVTEKHAVEAALRSNQERLALATQANGIGIWEFDLLTQRETWNDMMFQIYGEANRPSNSEPLVWRERIPPEDLTHIQHAIEEAVVTNQPINIDFRINLPTGGVREVNGRARVFQDRQGRPARLIGTIYDITEHKRMARELAEKHELLRVTLHSIGDAVITTDAHGRVQWLNPAAERMTGWHTGDAQGRPLIDVFHIVDEATREPEPCPITRCLSGEAEVESPSQTLLISRNGQEYGIEDTTAPIRDAAGQVLGMVLIFHDVTEQRRMGHEMSYRATHDPLTGLVNRSEFENRLHRALEDAQQRDSAHALMYIDLDQFKLVNDACGHAVGDLLLKQVTDLLQHCVRSRDTLARLGGDEFGVILEHCTAEQAQRVAQKICDQMEEFRFVHDGRRFRIGTSIGLVPLDKRWATTAAMMQAADTSCYAAKEAGRNRVHAWFDTDQAMQARKGEMQWATRIEQALDENRFVLYGQRIDPILPNQDGLRCEVLIRLRDDDGSIIPPGAFLPAAERFHLATRIDRWVVKHVLDLLQTRARELSHVHSLSVNLSGQSLGDPSFQQYLINHLTTPGLAVNKLCFEITETAAITKLGEASHFVEQIRRLGVRLALDDFGSGSSSFGYLKALAVDYLKIDGQFIKDVVHDPLDRAAVRCFCDVAHVMGLKTVGEFVDSMAVLQELQALGVDYAQGYLCHKPEPLEALLGLTPAPQRAVNA